MPSNVTNLVRQFPNWKQFKSKVLWGFTAEFYQTSREATSKLFQGQHERGKRKNTVVFSLHSQHCSYPNHIRTQQQQSIPFCWARMVQHTHSNKYISSLWCGNHFTISRVQHPFMQKTWRNYGWGSIPQSLNKGYIQQTDSQHYTTWWSIICALVSKACLQQSSHTSQAYRPGSGDTHL